MSEIIQWFQDRAPHWRTLKRVNRPPCPKCGKEVYAHAERLSVWLGGALYFPLPFVRVSEMGKDHNCGDPYIIITERGEEEVAYGVGRLRAVERWADGAGLKPNEIVRVAAYSALHDDPEADLQFFKVGHGGRGSVAWEDKL